MFLFLLTAVSSAKEITISPVSTRVNPFMSRNVPGIHYCPYSSPGEYSQVTRYSDSERTFSVPFNYSLSRSVYTHCGFKLKAFDVSVFSKLTQRDAFIRIYIDNRPFRTQFYYSDGNVTKLYTNFSIIWNTDIDELQINPSNPKELKVGEKIRFSFELTYGTFSSSRKQFHFNSSIYYFLGALLIVLTIVLIIYTISMQPDTIFSLNDVWAVPTGFKNIIFFLFDGIYYVLMFLTFLRVRKPGVPFENYMFTINYIPTIINVILESLISSSLELKIDETYWISPFLMYYLISVLPIRILNAFFNFFGSNRGYKAIPIFIHDATKLLIIYLFTRGIGLATSCFVSPYTAPVRVQKQTNAHRQSLTEKLCALLYVAASAAVLRPAVRHALFVALEDGEPSCSAIAAPFILYAALTAFLAALRNLQRLRAAAFSWDGLVAPPFTAMLAVGALSLARVASHFYLARALSLQSLAFAAARLAPYCIGTFVAGVAAAALATYAPLILTRAQRTQIEQTRTISDH